MRFKDFWDFLKIFEIWDFFEIFKIFEIFLRSLRFFEIWDFYKNFEIFKIFFRVQSCQGAKLPRYLIAYVFYKQTHVKCQILLWGKTFSAYFFKGWQRSNYGDITAFLQLLMSIEGISVAIIHNTFYQSVNFGGIRTGITEWQQ